MPCNQVNATEKMLKWNTDLVPEHVCRVVKTWNGLRSCEAEALARGSGICIRHHVGVGTMPACPSSRCTTPRLKRAPRNLQCRSPQVNPKTPLRALLRLQSQGCSEGLYGLLQLPETHWPKQTMRLCANSASLCCCSTTPLR